MANSDCKYLSDWNNSIMAHLSGNSRLNICLGVNGLLFVLTRVFCFSPLAGSVVQVWTSACVMSPSLPLFRSSLWSMRDNWSPSVQMIVYIYGTWRARRLKLCTPWSLTKKGLSLAYYLVILISGGNLIYFLIYLRITFGYLSFQSKWLYLGTERGNTYMVNVDSFSLSGYVVNWNKAIEL